MLYEVITIAEVANWDCFCEIQQLDNGSDTDPNDDLLNACQNELSDPPVVNGNNVNGWCYIDATAGVGNPDIVKSCPDTEKRLIRFVGAGNPQPGATSYNFV